jgi:hypothetical protein
MGFGSRHGKAPPPDFRLRLAIKARGGLVTALFALLHQRRGVVIGRLILAGAVAIGAIEETRSGAARIGTPMPAVLLFSIARSTAYFCGRAGVLCRLEIAALAPAFSLRLPPWPERKPVIVPVLALRARALIPSRVL